MDSVGSEGVGGATPAGPRRAGRRYGWRDALLAVHVVLCLLANTWPGYAWFGNSIEPYVLGVPFSLAWIVGWVVLTFVVLAVYHASGDEDPSDGRNGRFDTLFGARRFEFGPTGIYGPFARSNLFTAGGRVQVRPRAGVSAFLAYRGFWLAQKRDRWTTSGVWDPTGQSGRFLGHQIEIRGRWRPLPGNLLLELGWAHLFQGEFARTAPNAVATRDSDYFYTQVVIQL